MKKLELGNDISKQLYYGPHHKARRVIKIDVSNNVMFHIELLLRRIVETTFDAWIWNWGLMQCEHFEQLMMDCNQR